MKTLKGAAFGLLLGLQALPAPVRAENVVAVLSSGSDLYQNSFLAFQKAIGHSVPMFSLATVAAPTVGSDTRVIVAFGSKAAALSYPKSATLIYGMAPGTALSSDSRGGPTIQVAMIPTPDKVLSTIKEIQPGAENLTVFWASASIKDYLNKLEKASAGKMKVALVNIDASQVESDLDGKMKTWLPKSDAFWIPLDPVLLVQGQNAIKVYSSKVPFYVSHPSVFDAGPTIVASISSGVNSVGAAMAKTARQVLAGQKTAETIYPDMELIINKKSSGVLKGDIPASALAKAGKVVE